MDGVASLMNSNPVVFWLTVAVLAGVIEALTAGLFSIWFVIGALAAVIPAWFGASVDLQITAFIAASAFALALTRPFFQRLLRVKKTPTNADMVIGADAVVLSQVDNILGHGRVRAGGLEWEARSADGTKIEKGAVVKVVELSGVTLIVEKTTKQEEK